MPALRVLTLNLWGRLGPWPARAHEARAWIDALDPDVVLFQEVIRPQGGSTTAHEVCGTALPHHAFHGGPAGAFYREGPGVAAGVSVASRWPIDAWHPIVLPDGGVAASPRLALHVRTAGLDVCSMHLAAAPVHVRARQLQVLDLVRTLAGLVDPAADMPAVLGGDANAEPDSDEIRFLGGLCTLDGQATYWVDAVRTANPGIGWTLDQANPHLTELGVANRRVDHLFVGDGFLRPGGAGRVLRCDLACHTSLTGTLASDHHGLVADVSWPTRP